MHLTLVKNNFGLFHQLPGKINFLKYDVSVAANSTEGLFNPGYEIKILIRKKFNKKVILCKWVTQV